MRFYLRLFINIIFVCAATSSHAQNVSAWSVQYALPELTAFSDFPEPVEKIEQILNEERSDPVSLKAWVYAAGIETSLCPRTFGQWDTIPAKGYVWRTGIRAEKALSLNLLIENYRMQPGMALYVYNQPMTYMAGPFDHRNNANGGVLPVQSLPGDVIVVEWNIPLQVSQRNDFTITSVGYGFRDMTGDGKMARMAADDCDVDISCKTGNHWQREKRSVVRLETITPRGTQYCTGTLVNQAVESDRKKPYILTANHCISTEELAQRTTFVFGYEKPYCRGATPTVPAGITGSNLVAAKRELDFTLVEMSANVTDAQLPYYAGWTASSATPQSVACIHHPQGKVKKISVENDPLLTGTFSDPATKLNCDKDAHWIVRQWEEGITEQGSSGSPIFDASHRIAGTLTGGGNAICSKPINDYFSKFSKQWNAYYSDNDFSESLKPWLDPDNKGVTSLWGYDPIASYEDRCDTLGNIGSNETKILIRSGAWGYLTGHNDLYRIGFAEKIRNDTVANIIGMEADIAKVDEKGSKVQFTIWRGTDFPVTPLYVKDTIVPPDYSSYPMHVYFDKTLQVTGDFFIGYSLKYNNPIDTFAVYQSAKRPYAGLSCMYVEEYNGFWMPLSDEIPPTYSSLGVRVMGRFGKQTQPDQPSYQNLKIVFQPDNPVVFVYLEASQITAKVECYDTSGKRLLINEVSRNMVMYDETIYLQVELDVSSLLPGMYLIQAFNKKKKLSGKFVKL